MAVNEEAVNEEQEEYREVPPSEAPRLVPWTEDSTYLSPGGSVAGISAFAAAATTGRSRASLIFIRVVVGVVLVSLLAASVWRMGGPF